MLSRHLRPLGLALLLAAAAHRSPAQIRPEWTAPLAPFQISDHIYYVGSQDLAAYLITTPAGNILVNANLPSSPKQIRASVEKLGFRWQDTKILLTGQAHYDHAGGAAEVVRQTHAQLMVMEHDAKVIETGGKSDFLHNSGSVPEFPAVHVDRVLHDGDTVALGGLTLTAHRTGGHTRGCTTWTLQDHLPHEPAGKLRNVVIVGGYTLWGDFQLVNRPGHPESYPGIANDFRHTFTVYEQLPAEIFLADHGVHFGLKEKVARLPKEGETVWLDPQGYRTTIAEGKQAFEKALASQQAAK